MPIGNNAAILAGQLEKVSSRDLNDMVALDSVFWNLIKVRPKDVVSTRPERIVYKVGRGIKSRATGLDGQDLGRGGAPQFAYGNVPPVSFDWAAEWTHLSDIASDNREKAVFDYMSVVMKDLAKAPAFNLDSLMSYGDGSNTLCTVTSYDAGNLIIYVDNAARVEAGQDLDLYNGGLGTTMTSVVTVKGTVNGSKAIYLTSAPSTAPTVGALLLENNSPGTTGSGINGILAYIANRTGGTYTGVPIASYPGFFQTPNVNAGGATLTPQIARLLLAQIQLAKGVKATQQNGNIKFHMNLDQATAWENTGLSVTTQFQSGTSAIARDTLAAKQITTIGGIEIIRNIKAIQGRIDLIDFDTWHRTEVAELDLYRVGNTSMFPVYGASGGLTTSQISYMIWMGNFVCDEPTANAFISNLAIPPGY